MGNTSIVMFLLLTFAFIFGRSTAVVYMQARREQARVAVWAQQFGPSRIYSTCRGKTPGSFYISCFFPAWEEVISSHTFTPNGYLQLMNAGVNAIKADGLEILGDPLRDIHIRFSLLHLTNSTLQEIENYEPRASFDTEMKETAMANGCRFFQQTLNALSDQLQRLPATGQITSLQETYQLYKNALQKEWEENAQYGSNKFVSTTEKLVGLRR